MLNRKQADDILAAATGRKGATLGNLSKPELSSLPGVLVKMIVTATFKSKMSEYWTNIFTELNSLQDEVGALNKIVDAGLLTISDDEIKSAADLLPDLDAVPEQYAATFAITMKKRVELLISNDIYKLAFTSINAFGSFIDLIKSQIGNTIYVYLYKQIQEVMVQSVVNEKQLTGDGTKLPKDLSILDFINLVYKDIATDAPFSSNLNLGAINGDKTIKPNPLGQGIDKETAIKTNTVVFTKDEKGNLVFPEFNCFVTADRNIEIMKQLATTYHSDFISLEKKFGDVAVLLPEIENEFTAKDVTHPTDIALVILDKKSLFLSTRVEAMKNQYWAKGPGSGIQQIVFSFWKTIAFNPWANGRFYTAKLSTTKTTEANDEVEKVETKEI